MAALRAAAAAFPSGVKGLVWAGVARCLEPLLRLCATEDVD